MNHDAPSAKDRAAVNGWDIALLAIAIYVAVISLARMMISRRDALWEELNAEALAEQRRSLREQRRQQQSANEGEGSGEAA